MSAYPSAAAPPDARTLLEAAVTELDLIAADGLARDAADRLNGVSALIEEVISVLEEPQS